jgi:hypothetical protein
MSKSLATDTNFDFWLDCHVRLNRTSCIMLKIDNNLKWTKKQNLFTLSKEVLLVCAFYKLEYLSCIAVVLSKFCKVCSPCRCTMF